MSQRINESFVLWLFYSVFGTFRSPYVSFKLSTSKSVTLVPSAIRYVYSNLSPLLDCWSKILTHGRELSSEKGVGQQIATCARLLLLRVGGYDWVQQRSRVPKAFI